MRILSRAVFLGSAFAAAAHANPPILPSGCGGPAGGTGRIAWEPCSTGSEKKCGKFVVPLDYQSNVGNATLYVACSPADPELRIGTLFLNPGGPGESGVDFITSDSLSETIKRTGGRYDLVSWDPRGVDKTEPRISCFEYPYMEDLFWEGTIPRAGFEAPADFTDPEDLIAFIKPAPKVDALLHELWHRCEDRNGNMLKYVGTAAAARDLVSLHDYLEGPNQSINYWGLSYGTVLGIYFVNMFPGRVGRVVLDGVVDPDSWANMPPHKRKLASVIADPRHRPP